MDVGVGITKRLFGRNSEGNKETIVSITLLGSRRSLSDPVLAFANTPKHNQLQIETHYRLRPVLCQGLPSGSGQKEVPPQIRLQGGTYCPAVGI